PAVPPAGDGSAIVRSAWMTVRLDDVGTTAAVDRLGTAVAGLGGWVASTTTFDDGDDTSGEGGDAGQARAELVLRVPTARFDEARALVGGLGETTSVRLSGQDVSGQLVDTDARLRALRAEELALVELLGRADGVPAILQVRDRIAAVRTEIEQLDAQAARL